MKADEVLRYVTRRCNEACKSLIGQPNDVFAREVVRAKIAGTLKEYVQDRLKFDVTGVGDTINIEPKNLYTAIALMFPRQLEKCHDLSEEGQTTLSNGVVVRYTHEDGASVVPIKPAEFVTLNVTIGEPKNETA